MSFLGQHCDQTFIAKIKIHSLLDNVNSLEQTTYTPNRIRTELSFYHIRFYDEVFFKLLIRKATRNKIPSECL